MGNIKILGFRGMDNVKKAGVVPMDDNGIATPSLLLNADVDENYRLAQRAGYDKISSQTGSHSLWGGSVMLFVRWNENMDRYEIVSITKGGEIKPLVGINAGATRMWYSEVDGLVYCSNGFWTGVLEEGDIREWGVTLPGAPEVEVVESGNLPPGVYKLCFTRITNNQLGGNGPSVEVAWEGGTQGILVKNLEPDLLCWLTQPDGSDFFLSVVEDNDVIETPYYTQPLPTFANIPPPAMRYHHYGHNRMWGAVNRDVWFSEEYAPEMFRLANKLSFLEEVTQISTTQEGIYISSLNTTWWFAGRDPMKFETITSKKCGAIPGTLAYVTVEDTGNEISQRPAPTWMSPTGIVIGLQTGQVVNLTEGRLAINYRSNGVAIQRMNTDGRPQVIFTLDKSPISKHDSVLTSIFTNGTIFADPPVMEMAAGKLIMEGGS